MGNYPHSVFCTKHTMSFETSLYHVKCDHRVDLKFLEVTEDICPQHDVIFLHGKTTFWHKQL